MQSKQEIMINFEKEFITETPICHVCLGGKLSIDHELSHKHTILHLPVDFVLV